VVRRDLPLGTLAAQLIHAAGVSSLGAELPPDTRAVALAVADEPALVRLSEALSLAGLPHVRIHEPDPPWAGALMAIGVRPSSDRPRLRRVLGRIPLFGKDQP
jgi:hypothetical protein